MANEQHAGVAIPPEVLREAQAAELREAAEEAARALEEAARLVPTDGQHRRNGLPSSVPVRPSLQARAEQARRDRLAEFDRRQAEGLIPSNVKHLRGLEQVRAARGYSQAELAEKAGLDTLTVWRAENFKNPPQKKTARALARVLGIDLLELYRDEPRIPRATKQKAIRRQRRQALAPQ